MATIFAICLSEQRGTEKHAVNSARLIPDWGIEGDAHAGHWHRQVSLLSQQKIDEFKRRGAEIAYGAFGENIVADLDFRAMPVGTLLQTGSALLEITQIGKACHNGCAIYQRMGDCIMPREGVFARVKTGGEIHVGDGIAVCPRKGKRPYQAAVITLSDKGARGEREDTSGPAIKERLLKQGYEVIEALLLPDGIEPLKKELIRLSDQRQPDLILTTGGTGLSERDLTPEATLAVLDRLVPGISEYLRATSMQLTPRAMLSRGVCGIRKRTLILNLPGSTRAVNECLDAVMDTLPHGLDVLRGESGDCGR